MNDPDLFQRLGSLRAGLRELLELLAQPTWDPERVARVQARVDQQAAQLGEPAELWALVAEDEHPRLREALEGWLRDVALVSSAVGRDRERLRVELDHARAGLRSTRARRNANAPGGVCDVAG